MRSFTAFLIVSLAACGKGKSDAPTETTKPAEPTPAAPKPEPKPEPPKPAAPASDHIVVTLAENPDAKGAWRGGDIDTTKGIAYKGMNAEYRIDIPVDCPEFTCEKVGGEHWLWQNMRNATFCPKGHLVSLEFKKPEVAKQGKHVGTITTDKLNEKDSFVGYQYFDAPFEVTTLTADKITGTVDFKNDSASIKGGFSATVCKQ